MFPSSVWLPDLLVLFPLSGFEVSISWCFLLSLKFFLTCLHLSQPVSTFSLTHIFPNLPTMWIPSPDTLTSPGFAWVLCQLQGWLWVQILPSDRTYRGVFTCGIQQTFSIGYASNRTQNYREEVKTKATFRPGPRGCVTSWPSQWQSLDPHV